MTFVLTWHPVLFAWHVCPPCPRRAPMGHVDGGHRWDRVVMDLLDMSVTTAKGIGTFWSWWTVSPDGRKHVPLPNKTMLTVVDAFFQHIVHRFGMPIVIHSDQGREFENKIMQELCIMGGSHKTVRRVMEWWNALI